MVFVYQGVTSFSYDPTTPNGPTIITPAWVQDIASLTQPETGALLIRAEVKADNSGNLSPYYGSYQQAFSLYQAQQNATHGLLTLSFDPPNPPDNPNRGIGTPQDALGQGQFQGNMFLNSYINDFSFRAEDFASNMKNNGSGLISYFIWNEPNNDFPGNPEALDSAHFAAVQYQGYHRIKDGANTGGFVYMGGILWPVGAPGPNGPLSPTDATNRVHDYLQGVYQYLQQYGGGLPWDALNVHVHHCNGIADSDIAYLRSQIDSLRSTYNDSHPVYVGEWGITHDEAAMNGCMLGIYTSIRNHFDAMWYFQHPDNPHTGTPAGCSQTGDVYGLTEYTAAPGSPQTYQLVNPHCGDWDQLHYLLQYPTR